jgi:topoisomerase-4 subunit A
MATDAGYGFVTNFSELTANKKGGKQVLTVPAGAKVLHPRPVGDPERDWLAAVSNEGRLLVFPLRDLPEMTRGKGNKIIAIPGPRVREREEYVVAIQVLGEKDTLVVQAGKRHRKLTPSDLEHYRGERGRRGAKLPRGYQNVQAMTVERKNGG